MTTEIRHVCVGALLTVLALAGCEDVAPPLQITGMGNVEGFVFFDASEDGIFDPSDGDSVLADIGISV
ncbi:MAG: hypothetical protein R3246_17155, partial [Acidimicrobiia bacterium]|nr:hypothetical protein [Acidimicrobiia bacterium]